MQLIVHVLPFLKAEYQIDRSLAPSLPLRMEVHRTKSAFFEKHVSVTLWILLEWRGVGEEEEVRRRRRLFAHVHLACNFALQVMCKPGSSPVTRRVRHSEDSRVEIRVEHASGAQLSDNSHRMYFQVAAAP